MAASDPIARPPLAGCGSTLTPHPAAGERPHTPPTPPVLSLKTGTTVRCLLPRPSQPMHDGRVPPAAGAISPVRRSRTPAVSRLASIHRRSCLVDRLADVMVARSWAHGWAPDLLCRVLRVLDSRRRSPVVRPWRLAVVRRPG